MASPDDDVAPNSRKIADQALDETEFLHVVKLPAAEIERMISAGEFQQAVHITAWLLSLRRG